MQYKKGLDPYLKGERIFAEETGTSSEFYRIKNKPGYIARHLGIPKEVKGLSEVRKLVEEDLPHFKHHLSYFLPEYSLTYVPVLKDGSQVPENSLPDDSQIKRIEAYMFIEEVNPVIFLTNEDLKIQYLQELDDFLEQCGKMFQATWDPSARIGVAPDMNRKSLKFGTTQENPKPHLYLIDLYNTVHAEPGHYAYEIQKLIDQHSRDYGFPKAKQVIINLNNY